MLEKILAYSIIASVIIAVGAYIYYMVVCTKVELKKLEDMKNDKSK